MSAEAPSLRVSSHVIVQLGSELVTDVDQALLECVKNSYDADSPGCKIEVDTRAIGTIVERLPASRMLSFAESAENVQVAIYDLNNNRIDGEIRKKVDPNSIVERQLHYLGRVTIEDGGDGIPPEKIATSWLVISGSAKRPNADQPKRKTKRGRTPLGDKGLGRLGTMKLGDILEVESATSAEHPLTVAHFRWKDCVSAATVDQVPVFSETRANADRFKGTRVNVYGLHDMPEWRRKGRVQEIAASLAKLVSPFEATSTFPVRVTVDGFEESLGSITDHILSQAIAEFDFAWGESDRGSMQLVARAKFMTRLFTASRSKKQKEKADLAFNSDNGAGFREFLNTFPRTKAYEKSQPDKSGGYVEFVRRFPWSDMMLSNGLEISDPGPFHGAFYFFHLDARDGAGDGAAAGVASTPEQIKRIAGISILRDGFRVRSEGDWLNLSQGMTSGSIYNMRVNNTVGYFALTGENNFRLTEKSDREGFVENTAYRGFYQIAAKCRDFANDALENVRRGLDEYFKQLKEEQRDLPSTDPIQLVEESLQASDTAQAAARKAGEALQRELTALENGNGTQDATPQEASANAISIARKALAALGNVQAALPSRMTLGVALEQAKADREGTQEQLLALYESAAVGLSARGLAHELRTHIGDLRQRMTALVRTSKLGTLDEKTLAAHIRAMRDSCSAILSSASLIDPMIPRSRMLKETFDVADFVAEFIEHRKHEFIREDVSVSQIGGSVIVRMNKARLLQVLDNLVRNSVYWLKWGQIAKQVTRPKAILIDVGNQGFSVADSGPGVDPNYEDSLFEIFVSAKPKDTSDGQGLGLFIAKQLLAADGCDIHLTSDRNPDGRRFRFVVDLSTVRC